MAATDEETIAQLQLEIAQLKLQSVKDRALFTEELAKVIAENTALKAELTKKDNQYMLMMATRDSEHAGKDTEMLRALLTSKDQREELIIENKEVARRMEALQRENAGLHEKLAEAEANLNDVLMGGKHADEKSLVASFGRLTHDDDRRAARHTRRDELIAAGGLDRDLQRSLLQAPSFMPGFGRSQRHWSSQGSEF